MTRSPARPLVLALAFAAGCGGGPAALTTTELARRYDRDPVAADRDLAGKPVALTGYVLGDSAPGSFTLAVPDCRSLAFVLCVTPDPKTPAPAGGRLVTVRGTFRGRVGGEPTAQIDGCTVSPP